MAIIVLVNIPNAMTVADKSRLDSRWAKTTTMCYASRAMLIALSRILVLLCGATIALPQASMDVMIRGRVLDSAGEPVSGALVHVEDSEKAKKEQTTSDAEGVFTFSGLGVGTFSFVAEKASRQSSVSVVVVQMDGARPPVDLVLKDSNASNPHSGSSSNLANSAMEFADSPNFTVAGITDWTAAGGHGSDASLRTSEALNRETLTLKESDAAHNDGRSAKDIEKEREAVLRAALTNAPASFEANHKLGDLYLRDGKYNDAVSFLQKAFEIDSRNAENEIELAQACIDIGDLSHARLHVKQLMDTTASAAVHRLAGMLDEKSGDPLGAVHEYEQEVSMDPSEQAYFDWGSELLIHRAVWQAKEVFERGVSLYPGSVRLLTALGAALFAGALYEDAARRLCQASDFEPNDPEPYIFMGEVEIAAPNPLACIEQKLERFVQEQPDNSRGNYYLAMAIWKQSRQPIDDETIRKIESMLTKAAAIDPKFSDAYVQLGILNALHGDFTKAVELYIKAIEADPQSSEAHYRLGVAYDRMGERGKAKQEFQLHEDIEKQHAAAVDAERRAVKQFVVQVQDKPARSAEHQ
jgi:tetratricopeptide (TPR) repeat protein